MLKVGVTVLLKVSVGWLVVAGAEVEVVTVLPKPLKPVPLLLLAAVWTELARDWLKEVPATDDAGAGLPNWKMEARAGEELAAVTGGTPPNISDWEVEVMVPLAVLAIVFNPKPNTGFGAEAVVPEATVEVAVPRPVKRGADVAGAVAGAVVCFREKGADRGMGVTDSKQLKMGLNVGAVVLAVVGRVVLEEIVVAEELAGKGLSLSLLGVAGKMGLNMGEAQAGPGVAREEELAGGLSIPNSMLGFAGEERAEEAGVLTGCSAWGTPGDLVSASGVADEAGASPRKAAVGLESEEVPVRAPVNGETRGSRRPGVFGGEGAAVIADSASSEDGGAGESCIFFKLSNSGSELGAGREAREAAGPAVSRLKVKGGLAAGGVSVAEVEASPVLSSKTVLNHCREAFLSMSRSSAVIG